MTAFKKVDFPVEGHLDFISEDEAKAVVDTFFRDKVPARVGHRVAIVTHGAPGSGKTRFGYQACTFLERRSMIHVAYDEAGTMQALAAMYPEMAGVLKDDGAYEKYRPLSQYLRSQVLQRAVNEGYSVFVDVTASSPFVLSLLDQLKEAGYVTQVRSYFSPLWLASDRAISRGRPMPQDEFFRKRLGAHAMFAHLANEAMTFDAYYNPANDRQPEAFLHAERGVVTFKSPNVIGKVMADLRSEPTLPTELFTWLDYLRTQEFSPKGLPVFPGLTAPTPSP